MCQLESTEGMFMMASGRIDHREEQDVHQPPEL